jgi:non-homologous end joining protein Ku
MPRAVWKGAIAFGLVHIPVGPPFASIVTLAHAVRVRVASTPVCVNKHHFRSAAHA